ncbi:MAG TPA: SDR family oxidoreductase [Bacteroidia bacterium]|nr:SDR family oxidoreductase [Bacteroidia bacterium]
MNLVTGASGILGSHVVLELLRQNQAVRACKRPNSNMDPIKRLFALHFQDWEKQFEKINWTDLDVCDLFAVEEALEGIDTVYHCAGMVSFRASDREQLFRVNEGGTRNMVNACLQRKGIRLCHVSSIAAINNSDHRGILHEGVFWKRSGRENDYTLSKYNAEREVWRGLEEGLNAVILNPGVILAPALWNHSSSMLIQAASGNRPFYTSGTSAYVAAEDVARIMYRLVNEGRFGERFIVVENNYPYRRILETMHKAFAFKSNMYAIPYPLLRCFALLESLWCLFSGKPARLNTALIRAAYNRQTYSNEKVKSTLQYEFIPIEPYLEKRCKMYQLGPERPASMA